MLKDTVAFAKHIEDMMRDTLGVSKEESVEEEDELPEEVEEGKIFFFHLVMCPYLSKKLVQFCDKPFSKLVYDSCHVGRNIEN